MALCPSFHAAFASLFRSLRVSCATNIYTTHVIALHRPFFLLRTCRIQSAWQTANMAATSRQTWYLLLLERTQSFVTALTALVVIVLLRASSHSLYYVLGSLVTAWTAKGLKRFIRQPRPVYEDEDETRSPTTRRRKKVKSHGMPSTHSA